MGDASVNGNANFHTAYEPLLPGCHDVPAPQTYRNPFNESDPARLAQLCLQALEDEIAFQGAGTIATLITEPILGAADVTPPHPSFMPTVEAICRTHGILLIADAVITAFGRTGAWTGSRLWGVKPDFSCTAKAITNGHFPLGAVMIAIEPVSDGATKSAPPKAQPGAVQTAAYKAYAMVRVSGPNIASTHARIRRRLHRIDTVLPLQVDLHPLGPRRDDGVMQNHSNHCCCKLIMVDISCPPSGSRLNSYSKRSS